MTDYYGNSLGVGTKVAFNYQGQVRKGTIERIVEGTKYGRPNVSFKVRHWLDSEVSTVSNKANLIVIGLTI